TPHQAIAASIFVRDRPEAIEPVKLLAMQREDEALAKDNVELAGDGVLRLLIEADAVDDNREAVAALDDTRAGIVVEQRLLNRWREVVGVCQPLYDVRWVALHICPDDAAAVLLQGRADCPWRRVFARHTIATQRDAQTCLAYSALTRPPPRAPRELFARSLA